MGPALNPVFRGLARLARPLARPAAWLLRRQQAYLLWRLRRAIRDADAFDVVGNMFLSVAPVNNEPGDGSDGTRLLSKPELTALLFAERRSPAPRRPSPARVLGLVDKLIPRVLHTATLRALFEQVRVKHQDSAVVPRITLAAITREIYLRLPRFHQKERELLSELFTPELHDSLVARVGFGPDAMFAIYDAFHSYIPQRLAQRAEAAKEEFTEALQSSAEFASILHSHAGGFDDAFRRVVGRRAFDELPALVALSRQDMMTATDVPEAELDALLSLMSIDLDADNVGVVADFLSGNNVMRTRPFLARADANGEKAYMLVQPTSLIFGMRELFEAALTLEPTDQSYIKHRGQLLEERGMRALVDAIRPDTALMNVTYVGADGKRFETDGLLIIGEVAIIVEAKSNRLTPYARGGAPVRLWKELGPIISKAAHQAERLSAFIESGTTEIHVVSSMSADQPNKLVRKNWDLDVRNVRQIFTIALTLEDLNYIATISSELVESGLIPAEAPSPWVVNVHDLEVTARLLTRPSEFVQFLSRRRRASAFSNIQAIDELDYVMHYLMFGLFPEGAMDTMTLVQSLTDDLDAWMFYEDGLRETPAPKPQQEIDVETDEILSALDEHRPFGWMGASTGLLELAPAERERISHEARRLRELSAVDGTPHSMYFETAGVGGKPLIFIVMSFPPGARSKAITDRLTGYATLRRYASRADAVYCFGSVAGSDAVFDMFLTLDSEWEVDSDLDEAVQAAGLAPGIEDSGEHRP